MVKKADGPDRLVPSTKSVLVGSFEVEKSFIELCSAYLRINFKQLKIPPELQGDLQKWRQMVVRHRAKDFRHTDGELKALKAFAQWTIEVNCKMRNQPIPQNLNL